MPLAVSLIGHQAEGEPDLAGVWTRWQTERTAMVARLGGDVRDTSLEVSYETSYSSRRMDNGAKALLSACGDLPDGVAHTDLDAISPEGRRAASILRKVGLAFDDANRLRLLAPVREFARLRHPPRLEDRLRVMKHYFSLAIEHGDQIGHEGGSEAVRRLSSEVANIESLVPPEAGRPLDP